MNLINICNLKDLNLDSCVTGKKFISLKISYLFILFFFYSVGSNMFAMFENKKYFFNEINRLTDQRFVLSIHVFPFVPN